MINTYKKTLNIQKYNLDKYLYKASNKIKIGFLSSDLKAHAVGFQILGVIEKLSLDNDFELYCYSLNESESSNKSFGCNNTTGNPLHLSKNSLMATLKANWIYQILFHIA